MTKKTFTVWLIIAIIAQFAFSGPVTAAFTYAVSNMLEDIFSGPMSSSGSGQMDDISKPNYDQQYPSQGENPDREYGNTWNGDIKRSFSGGSGREDNPYLIASPQELAFLAECVNEGDTKYNNENVYYEIYNDFYLDNILWTPIGTDENPFRGHFLGNGRSISDVYVDGEKLDARNLGLFGVCEGSIEGLYVEKAEIRGYKYTTNAGALCGWLKGTVSDCGVQDCGLYFDGIRNDEAQHACFGGLIGYASRNEATQHASILRCYSAGLRAIELPGNIGGLVGYCRVIIEGCSAESSIENAYIAQSVGGLVGRMEGRSIKNRESAVAGAKYSHASVEASNARANASLHMGGLVGISHDAGYYACYSTGFARLSYGVALGGFAGGIYGGFVEQCFSGLRMINSSSMYSGGFAGVYSVSNYKEGSVGMTSCLAYHIPSVEDSEEYDSVGAFIGYTSPVNYAILGKSILDCCYSTIDRWYIDGLQGSGKINGMGIPASHEGLENADIVFDIMSWSRDVWDSSNYYPTGDAYFTLKYFN